jgi:hypothetical protein
MPGLPGHHGRSLGSLGRVPKVTIVWSCMLGGPQTSGSALSLHNLGLLSAGVAVVWGMAMRGLLSAGDRLVVFLSCMQPTRPHYLPACLSPLVPPHAELCASVHSCWGSVTVCNC